LHRDEHECQNQTCQGRYESRPADLITLYDKCHQPERPQAPLRLGAGSDNIPLETFMTLDKWSFRTI
jgi:hypothetical protein